MSDPLAREDRLKKPRKVLVDLIELLEFRRAQGDRRECELENIIETLLDCGPDDNRACSNCVRWARNKYEAYREATRTKRVPSNEAPF